MLVDAGNNVKSMIKRVFHVIIFMDMLVNILKVVELVKSVVQIQLMNEKEVINILRNGIM